MTGIDLRSVGKSYSGQPVLRGVSLSVPAGAVLALLGPSGCGKTTLLRLIAGFERLDSGEVALGGEIVASAALSVPPERRHIGYVPQEGALFPHLTVAGNVGYGLPRSERKGPRVAEVLALVGLEDLAGRQPHELSGGQQQRVALARALAPKPAVILLDEPFNALDLDLRRSMSEEVVALLRRAGATAVLVTHDPLEAFAAADLIAVMENGTVAQCAAPETIYRTPATAGVARITGRAIFLDGVMRAGRIVTRLGVLSAHSGWCAEGRPVTAMLRPEQLVPCGDGAGYEVGIVRQRFRGDHTLLSVVIDDMAFDIRTTEPVGTRSVRLRVEGRCCVFTADQDG
jgi:iron(III) transport system ATP-binding protein